MTRARGPLANSYPAAAALVSFALIPYLVLSSAMAPLTPVLTASLHLSQQGLQLTNGMANAGYAVGTVLAVQFASHLPQRRMLLLYVTLFVLASAAAAWAPTSGVFVAAHVLQGLCTSLMLIAAVPPLVIGWPARRMPITALVMNMCIFGAVAAGPAIGGVQAAANSWRPLFWLVTACGAVALALVLLTYEDQPAQDRSAPWDLTALLLAGFGCAAAFFGASQLEAHPAVSLIVLVPLVAGVVAIVLLVVHQYAAPRPLMPVRQLCTTKPVAGIVIAMAAGAASVAAIELVGRALQTNVTPGHAATLLLPELAGAAISAVLFAAVFRTRAMSLMPFAGISVLAGGIGVVTGVLHGPHALVTIGSGVIGLGVGAAVSPALFTAGFSVVSKQIQRVFALIELLRAVAAFMIAPIVLHVALTTNGGPKAGGIATGLWICIGIAAAGALASAYLWILGRAVPQAPDLERWQSGEQPAWDSPPIAARLRRRADLQRV